MGAYEAFTWLAKLVLHILAKFFPKLTGPSTQTDVEVSGVGVDTVITFGAGPAAPDVIRVNVTINDDQVGLEAVEMFPVSLELSQPNQAVAVGAPDTTIVNIIDDDGRFTSSHKSLFIYHIMGRLTSNQERVNNVLMK